MNQNEREAFFSQDDTGIIGALTGRSVHQDNAATQVASGDFEATTGYTRHRPKGMTAQYLNECVDKRNGMEVVDNDGDVWGWVYDCHKNIGKWFPEGTHDVRVKLMAKGFGIEELKPTYEPYQYTTPPGTPVFPAVGDGGFTVENHLYPAPPVQLSADDDYIPSMGERLFTDHMHVPVNDPVNPDHYRSHPSGVECIQITEHMNFNLGNTIKYVWRAGLKTDNPTEDIKKALWYLRRELSRIEGES